MERTVADMLPLQRCWECCAGTNQVNQRAAQHATCARVPLMSSRTGAFVLGAVRKHICGLTTHLSARVRVRKGWSASGNLCANYPRATKTLVLTVRFPHYRTTVHVICLDLRQQPSWHLIAGQCNLPGCTTIVLHVSVQRANTGRPA